MYGFTDVRYSPDGRTIICDCDEECMHNISVNESIVHRRGDWFYACAKLRADPARCRAFAWEDQLPPLTSTQTAEHAAYELLHPQFLPSPKSEINEESWVNIGLKEENDVATSSSYSEFENVEGFELECTEGSPLIMKEEVNEGIKEECVVQNEGEEFILPANSEEEILATIERKTRSSTKNKATTDSHLDNPISPVNKKNKFEYPITPTPSQSKKPRTQYEAIAGPSNSHSQSQSQDTTMTFEDESQPSTFRHKSQTQKGSQAHLDAINYLETVRLELERKDEEILDIKRREEFYLKEIEDLRTQADIDQENIKLLKEQLCAYQP